MGIGQLLRWQWKGYPQYHQSRVNLLIHIVAVPLSLLGTVTLVVAVVQLSLVLLAVAVGCIVAAVALQGGGHRLELVPPEPFSGPLNFVSRLFLEQWVTFPRFVITGGWGAALRKLREPECAVPQIRSIVRGAINRHAALRGLTVARATLSPARLASWPIALASLSSEPTGQHTSFRWVNCIKCQKGMVSMAVKFPRTPDGWMSAVSAVLLAGYLMLAMYALFSPSNDPQRGMAQGFITFVAFILLLLGAALWFAVARNHPWLVRIIFVITLFPALSQTAQEIYLLIHRAR